MNYERIYAEFIADRKSKEPEIYKGLSYYGRSIKDKRATWRGAPLPYFEHHHIAPKWRGGDNKAENIVALSPRDHFFAHALLAKAFGGKEWAAFWSMAGLRTGKRDFGRAIRKSRLTDSARSALPELNKGSANKKAVLLEKTWINYKTGERFIGSRHALVEMIGHGKTAKWEVGAHLFGRTLLTRSGWFSTERFASVEAVNEYKEQIKQAARSATAEKNSGGKHHGATKVVNIDTGKTYSTQKEAAEDTGALQPKISECCNGTRKSAGGYRWAYAETA
jgi:hypothetical protein